MYYKEIVDITLKRVVLYLRLSKSQLIKVLMPVKITKKLS